MPRLSYFYDWHLSKLSDGWAGGACLPREGVLWWSGFLVVLFGEVVRNVTEAGFRDAWFSLWLFGGEEAGTS